MQTPVENPLMTIASFDRQFRIGEKEREAIKWGWEQEMGKTMFHVVNAYTRAAQFEGLSAEASYRPQKVGGMVLGMVKWIYGGILWGKSLLTLAAEGTSLSNSPIVTSCL